jgi:hypothetical protein
MLREELRQMSNNAALVSAYLEEIVKRDGNVTRVMQEVQRIGQLTVYTGVSPTAALERLTDVAKRSAELTAYLKRCEVEWDAIERGVADVRAGRIGGMPLVTSGDQQGAK